MHAHTRVTRNAGRRGVPRPQNEPTGTWWTCPKAHQIVEMDPGRRRERDAGTEPWRRT